MWRYTFRKHSLKNLSLSYIFWLWQFFNVAITAWKVSRYGVFSGPRFPTSGMNTNRYFVSLRIQSKCGKIRTGKNSAFGYFSRSSYRPASKCVKIKTNMPSETLLGFTEEEEIHKCSSMTEQSFAHFLRFRFSATEAVATRGAL